MDWQRSPSSVIRCLMVVVSWLTLGLLLQTGEQPRRSGWFPSRVPRSGFNITGMSHSSHLTQSIRSKAPTSVTPLPVVPVETSPDQSDPVGFQNKINRGLPSCSRRTPDPVKRPIYSKTHTIYLYIKSCWNRAWDSLDCPLDNVAQCERTRV